MEKMIKKLFFLSFGCALVLKIEKEVNFKILFVLYICKLFGSNKFKVFFFSIFNNVK